MKQIFNPYLPQWEYIPDGEPHLFDGRVYIYGSHDVPHGEKYCEGHYVTWSAPEDDLTDWRFEGEIYKRTQDPSNAKDEMQLWAPDVTKGPDGRYYLYYCFSFYEEIGVAVSDSPAGPFEFYGHVHYPKHINNGADLHEFFPFDPAVLTDDDGRVYLYYGFAPGGEKEMKIPKPEDIPNFESLPIEEQEKIKIITSVKFSEGAMVAELEPDMLTLKEVPRDLIPGENLSEGTSFKGHGFFEASSMRKVGAKYYFVYSSHKSHELCYATSDYPDKDFVYGGTLVSNGDIGLDGRTQPVNTMGNNHGGMVCANGEWYVFYHRQTNGTEASRQGCAEKLDILPDGSIKQAEITSCGLNGGPLNGTGIYPAYIACHVTSKHTLTMIDYTNPVMQIQTRITEDVDSDGVGTKQQYVTDIEDGTILGYKYFDFKDLHSIGLNCAGDFTGTVILSTDMNAEDIIGTVNVDVSDTYTWCFGDAHVSNGVYPLYLTFKGDGKLKFNAFELK